MKIASGFEIYIERFSDIEVLTFQMIIAKIENMNKKLAQNNNPIKEIERLTLGLNYDINIDTLRWAISKHEHHF
jgi:hypothetical protein